MKKFKNIKTRLIAFIFALMLTVLVTGTAEAANYSLLPSSSQFGQGCESVVNIIADTEGVDSDSADVVINYDPSKIEIVDQNTSQAGVQIREGSIYDVYAANEVDESAGVIKMTAFSILSSYNGSGNLGAIVFRSKAGATSANFDFDFTPGETRDSNIAQVGGLDVLSSVTGGTYTFVDLGFCGTDSIPPAVTNADPAPSTTANPLDSNITFDISDALSGVHINTVRVKVDSNVYQNGDSEFSFTGNKSQYSITIDPATDFLPGTPVYVEVDAEDMDGNVMNTYKYSFNQVIEDNAAPFVSGLDPGPGENDVPLNSNIVFHVKDNGSGVNIDTVIVSIDGEIYKRGDAEFGFSGDSRDYFIVIDPRSDFQQGAQVYVDVDASDLDGNAMATYKYSFNHPGVDNLPPFVSNLDPASGARGVSVATNISFNIRDTLGGVDLSTVVVDINGTTYSQGDSAFSFSGDKSNYRVTINPSNDLPDGQITVRIDGADLNGNLMNTHIYSFNKPAICGDGYVEVDFGEQCEPPGVGSCTEDCQALACEVVDEDVESACGNGVIEQGEQCEPPGVGLCSNVCRVLSKDEEEVSKLTGFLKLGDDQKEQVLQAIGDDDGDGLPDKLEEKYGTGLGNDDSDGDGISDLEEILEYGTDPTVANELEISLKIVNWKDGDITSNGKLFVRGVAEEGRDLKIFAESVETGTQVFLGELKAKEGHKFAFLSKVDLENGEYLLYAQGFNREGEMIEESGKIRIIVDHSKIVAEPRVESIADIPVLEGINIVVFDQQPVVFGSTEPGAQVFITFESQIFSSTVISDSLSGFFTLFAPRPLEIGTHKLTAYAVSPEGVASQAVEIEFEVEKQPLKFLKGINLWFIITMTLLALFGGYLGYVNLYAKKKLLKNGVKEVTGIFKPKK